MAGSTVWLAKLHQHCERDQLDSHPHQRVSTGKRPAVACGPCDRGTGATSSVASLTVTGAPATLTIHHVGNQVQLLWPNGTLQTATLVTGPYTNITSAV